MIKRKGRSQIGHLTPDHKSLESRGQMRFDWSVLYTIENMFSKAIRYCPCPIKTNFIWKRYEHLNSWDNESPNLGSPRGKWHLDVILVERHKVYYREGSGASSQRLWAVWSLCLKLSLLSPPHHFHLTCTNRLILLVM
jgi:hypothetical protein